MAQTALSRMTLLEATASFKNFKINNLLRYNTTILLNNQRYLATNKNESGEYMKKLDMSKDIGKLPRIQQIYVRRFDDLNKRKNDELKQRRRIARITATVLFTLVFSIYFYTMYAIKQEKFLDDFTVPEPPDPAAKNL